MAVIASVTSWAIVAGVAVTEPCPVQYAYIVHGVYIYIIGIAHGRFNTTQAHRYETAAVFFIFFYSRYGVHERCGTVDGASDK